MAVLTGPEIRRIVELTKHEATGFVPERECPYRIDIEPFDPKWCGPNSVDVHLAPELKVYALLDSFQKHPGLHFLVPAGYEPSYQLDMRQEPPPLLSLPIDKWGLMLMPGVLYLGSTVERTRTEGLVPWLDGRSSVGRLGMSVHVTAGRGEDGFGADPTKGPRPWTFEITVVHPLRVYAGARIGQLTYMTLEGERAPYSGRYQDQEGPTASRFWTDADTPKTETKI